MKILDDWTHGQLFLGLAVLAAISMAYMSAGYLGYQDEVRQAELYCDMVQRYKETAGREGWPDYKSTYSELCDD